MIALTLKVVARSQALDPAGFTKILFSSGPMSQNVVAQAAGACELMVPDSMADAFKIGQEYPMTLGGDDQAADKPAGVVVSLVSGPREPDALDMI